MHPDAVPLEDVVKAPGQNAASEWKCEFQSAGITTAPGPPSSSSNGPRALRTEAGPTASMSPSATTPPLP